MTQIKGELDADTIRSNNKLYQAWANCLRFFLYGGAIVGFVITVALAGLLVYLAFRYSLILASDDAKLEKAVNMLLTFIFGGAAGASGGLMLRQKTKEEPENSN